MLAEVRERIRSVAEELREVESLPELKAIWCHWVSEAPAFADEPVAMSGVRQALRRLRSQPRPEEPTTEQLPEEVIDLLKRLDQLEKGPKPPIIRATRKYQLLKKEVDWSTKPQVHAVMQILTAHMAVGDIVDESDIVAMMVANEELLETKQGGKRIWDYYKGDHNQGLVAHGNVRRI